MPAWTQRLRVDIKVQRPQERDKFVPRWEISRNGHQRVRRTVIRQHRPVTIQDLAAQTFRTQTAQAVLFGQAQEVFSLEDLELPHPSQQQAETEQHDRN